MGEVINVYCDESCHLEHDPQKVMVLGAVWCPETETRRIATEIRHLKAAFNLPKHFEVKWTKVSKGKAGFYLRLMRYFFEEPDLHFRALVVSDKTKLRHQDFAQDHDTWYYKMHYEMLRIILNPEYRYRIYLDIKDTCGEQKRQELHDVLCASQYDFAREMFERVQCVRSFEVEQLQLADLLIGAVSYANRGLTGILAKVHLVEQMRRLSHYSLLKSTLPAETKVNIFQWHASEVGP